MQGEADVLRRLRVHDHIWSRKHHARFVVFQEGFEMGLDQFADRRAAPVLLNQQIMGMGEPLQALGEARAEFGQGR